MKITMKLHRIYDKNRHIFALLAVAAVSLAVFITAGRLEHVFADIMSVATYLTWHNLFEFISIVVSVAVFCVAYFTYSQSGRLRSLFLGCVFFMTGLIDAFHTLSFKDMPDFFISNTSPNRATTLWVFARLFCAAGFFISSWMNINRKSSIRRVYFLGTAIVLSLGILLLVTYFPGWIPVMYDNTSGLTPIKIMLEWLIILLFFSTILRYVMEYKRTKDILLVILSGALVVSIFSELAFVSYRNDVHHIYNYLGHVYKCIAYFIIFKVIFIYNVQNPYRQLSQAKNELKEYAENLDKIVDKRTMELKRINQKLLVDLEYARDIQKAMLPARLPEEKEVSFCAQYDPAESVGGDFYHVFKLDEQHIGLYIGDVAGHGVPAAMLTVFINQGLSAMRDIMVPSKVLSELYTSFNKTNFKDDIYVVLLYCIYNIKTKKLVFASAGMNAAPILIKEDGSIHEIEIAGLPICKFMEYYTPEYLDQELNLECGDKVLFYTDGLVEAENERGERYSENKLKRLLAEHSGMGCNALSQFVLRDVFGFIGSNKLKDDISLLIMEISTSD